MSINIEFEAFHLMMVIVTPDYHRVLVWQEGAAAYVSISDEGLLLGGAIGHQQQQKEQELPSQRDPSVMFLW
jgi:hypothetical protein